MPISKPKISCIILAGGEGKRVGGVDKGLIEYRNKTLIEYVIDTIKPQIDELVISANRNIERYKQYTDKVITDDSEQYRGPLAGINAALAHCTYDWTLILPCDTPFLPADIIDKFLSVKTKTKLYIAESNSRLQPVMLIHRSLQDSIGESLEKNELRLMHWVKSHQPQVIRFQNNKAFKSFNNKDDFKP